MKRYIFTFLSIVIFSLNERGGVLGFWGFGEYNNMNIMNKIIKDCIIGTTIIISVVLFLAAAVISLYKAFGY
jgi:hypothetical protein